MPPQPRSLEFVRPSFADPHSGRIILLASDLAGACDSAAAFLRSGRSVRIWFEDSVLFSAPESVQAFSTNSLSLSPGSAARVVSRATAALGADPNSLFFKSVDSAARGPIAAEVLATHHALGTRAILFAPAFPVAGRTVHEGVLEIQDAAGEPVQIRLDGVFPLLARSRICHISRASELAPAIDSGKTVLICDSETQDELNILARAAENLPGLLYAGSAGLAQALASLNPLRVPAALVHPSERTLLIAGSSHPVTKLQLDALDSVHLDRARILHLGLSFRAAARIRSVFRSYAPQALVLAGGDAALIAVRALEACSFVLLGEFAPGIPWGIVQGGAAHGCTVVTKSGGLGSSTALNEVLSALRGPA